MEVRVKRASYGKNWGQKRDRPGRSQSTVNDRDRVSERQRTEGRREDKKGYRTVAKEVQMVVF